jgi:hypothetical protein
VRADSIDDLDVLRAGATPTLFDGVYAPSTLGVLLRKANFGHARPLESVLQAPRGPRRAPGCIPCINFNGRYPIARPELGGGLRSLRDPAARDDDC